jgi:hypothetical protein
MCIAPSLWPHSWQHRSRAKILNRVARQPFVDPFFQALLINTNLQPYEMPMPYMEIDNAL